MRFPAIAVVTLFGFAAGACSSSSDEASGGNGKGGGPSTGAGGSGGGSGAVTGQPSGDDFGYATEQETSDVLSAQGPTNALVATVCGEVDLKSMSTLKRTPADPHSLASAARAREMIRQKQAPISAGVRTDDHLSYYRIGATADPKPNELTTTVALRPLAIAGQVIPRRYELFVGVQAGPMPLRPPVALTVVVDTTPSMAGEPLARARRSLRALADALVANDHLAVLTTDLATLFDQQLVDPLTDTLDIEQKLDLGGETALRVPIENALDKASSLLSGSNPQWNQVVLISDGQGDPQMLPLVKIVEMATTGVRLSTVGVGGSFIIGDALLYEASHAGRGSYVYVDDLEEPDKMLRTRFDQLLGVLFDDVHLTVKLPWLLKSLDDGSPNGASDTPVPQAIAPGGTMAFVYNLQSCSEMAVTKYGAQYPINVEVSYVNPADQQASAHGKDLLVSDLLTASPAGLDAVLATRAYVSALKGPTSERFTDAFALLAPLKKPGNAFEEMWNLLDAYPKKP